MLEDEETCIDVFDDIMHHEPGIVSMSLDANEQTMRFDYDRSVLPETQMAEVAEELAPLLQARWETCTMRLARHGGRACEACAEALERRVRELPGVRRASASYAGGVLAVTYDGEMLSRSDLNRYVQALGAPLTDTPEAAPSIGTGWRRLRAWLTPNRVELLFTVITFVAMIGGLIAEQYEATVAASILYVIAYVAGGTYGLRAGLQSLREFTIDVDLLMILAALGAAAVGAPFEGAMLLFLFSLSNVLQNYALDRTRNAIRSLMALRPEEAMVKRGDRLITLPLDRVRIGDRVVVRPGERIPLDGTVLAGTSGVDQSAITGESIPVAKSEGDTVLAGTINGQGGLEVAVTRLAKDSTIAKLIQMVEEAQSEQAKTQRFIDKAEQYYAVGVILFTAAAIVVPITLLGEPFDTAFYRAMTLMVAASPCAIVISTPATVLSAIANGARRGVLFKGGIYVERAAEIKVIAFDKTGTLTQGEPKVTDVVVLDSTELSPDEFLALAASVETKSEHPLAQAVVMAARGRGLEIPAASDFQSSTGQGVRAQVSGKTIMVGNRRFLNEYEVDLARASELLNRLQSEGKTSIVVAELLERDCVQVLGVLGIADTLRSDAPEVVTRLKELGVERVVMLTGDNRRVAEAIAKDAGVDAFYAELLPEDKMKLLKDLADQYGKVAMVGDGVNDAPALAAADIGIAMGAAGTDVAMETADVVLMADDLHKIPYLIALSHKTRRTLVQNLVFAIGMIVVLIGAVLGFSLALPLSVIGHEGSTVLVSLNGLRLLGFKET